MPAIGSCTVPPAATGAVTAERLRDPVLSPDVDTPVESELSPNDQPSWYRARAPWDPVVPAGQPNVEAWRPTETPTRAEMRRPCGDRVRPIARCFGSAALPDARRRVCAGPEAWPGADAAKPFPLRTVFNLPHFVWAVKQPVA